MVSPIMRQLILSLLCLATIGAKCFAGAEAPEPGKHDPLFTGTSLPLPPQQGKPWTPPRVNLPQAWVDGIRALVRQGFADPRGCDYREVKLAFGGATHAWVIPQGPSEKQGGERFAVTWDGLVYPLIQIGEPASVQDDMEALLAETVKHPSRRVRTIVTSVNAQGFGSGGWEEREVWMDGIARRAEYCSEQELVSQSSLLGPKSCTLLLLGEGALSERIWGVWTQQEGDWSPDAMERIAADEWGWALFLRAIEAHRRGDDVIATLTAKTLIALRKAKEEHPVFKRWPNRLAEDGVRRLQTPPIRRVLETGLDKFPDRSQRIAALVRDLEVADATDLDFFGYSPPPDYVIATSPIVKALVNEGLPAVGPLLKCLSDDRRLTRAIQFTGVSGRNGFYIVTADEAAFAALRQILKFNNFGPTTKEGYCPPPEDESSAAYRRAAADEIRGFWLKHRGQTQAETWLAVLADSDATQAQWLDAAHAIVEPVPPRVSDAGQLPADEQAEDEVQNTTPLLAGEILRGKQNPSVAQAMAERADEIDQLTRFSGMQTSSRDLSMTLCLAKWDAKAAVPSIRRRFAEWHEIVRHRGDGDGGWEQFLQYPPESLALLAEASIRGRRFRRRRLRVVDPRHARKSILPRSPFPLPARMAHPENAKMAELSRWAFLSESSFWRPDHKSDRPWWGEWTSRLLAVPAFREMLKRELADATIIGTATFDFSHDQMWVEIAGIPGKTGASRRVGNCPIYVPDVEVPQSLDVPLRRSDECAYQLSALEGVPRFELYWPEKKRNAALAEIARFFDRWGDAFRDRNTTLDADRLRFDRPSFRLARLSHPATTEDVAAGRAIFSFPRDGAGTQVRVVPLRSFPTIRGGKRLSSSACESPL